MIETPPRILVVEDVALIRTIYDITFAEVKAAVAPDLVVEFAVDGREAIERMARTPPIDLLLLDLYLPVLNGFEVLEFVRENEALRGVKIAVVSSRGSAYRTLAESLGIDAFLEKPARFEALKSMVTKLLGPRLSAPAS